MLLAIKGDGENSGDWITGYTGYMEKYAPKDYGALRRPWLRAMGRHCSFLNYLG